MFDSHKLNGRGLQTVAVVREIFTKTLADLDEALGTAKKTRENSIVATKLEEACFFAVRAASIAPENQEGVDNAAY